MGEPVATVAVPRRFIEDFLKALNFHGGHGTPSFERAYAELLASEATHLLNAPAAPQSAARGYPVTDWEFEQQQKAATREGWIPVAEKLPDDELTVMVAITDSDETVWLGWHDESGWYSVEATPIKVTHWMLRPAGPKP